LYTIPNADDNRYCHSYRDADGHTETFTGAEICANAQAAAHPATAPVTIYEKETHCSTPTSGREHAKNFRVRYPEPAQFNWIISCRCAYFPGFLCRRESIYACRGGSCWRSNPPSVHESYATRRNPEYAPW
jgi:hypothetical protein